MRFGTLAWETQSRHRETMTEGAKNDNRSSFYKRSERHNKGVDGGG